MTDTYAIIESGGKQYRAEQGSELVVDRLSVDEGEKVNLRALMFRGDGEIVLDGGDLEKVKVEAKVAEHLRGEKLRVFKYKPKKGYRRRAGHRSELTKLEIVEVKMLTRKPAAKAESKPKAEAGTKSEPKAKAESKPKAKSAAKKGSGKAATAKKPAAKKPAAKKPAAEKGSASGSSAKGKTSSKKKQES